MRTQDAKRIHLKDLLSTLGVEPEYQNRGEWWYCSPFRQEEKASFKVSRDGKAFYDHGAGVGGNILTFVCVYYGLHEQDISGALGKLDALSIVHATSLGDPSSPSAQSSLWENAHQRAINARRAAKAGSGRVEPQQDNDGITITKIQPLQSLGLIRYLEQRGIEKATAQPFIQEMHYRRGDKPYYSLAFASRSGGYELRNPYFKGAQGRKDITIVNEGSRAGECAVFEGFMDFLSWLQHTGKTKPEMPVVILNSTGMRKRAVEAIQAVGVETVHLYPDHDESGRDLVRYMQEQLQGCTIIDQSHLYAADHDYNAFLLRHAKAVGVA